MNARKIPWRWLVAALAAFLIAGIAAPFLSADRFAGRIGKALEASLGRKVKIGKVRFTLLSGPGFTISDVEIADNPAFGIEPIAQIVDSLDARLQLKSLWTGKLQWASVRLNQPQVNLVKADSGHWNFEPMLTPNVVSSMPRIEVRDARVNVKFGDTKSIYYIDNVDMDAVARTSGAGTGTCGFPASPAAPTAPPTPTARVCPAKAAGGRIEWTSTSSSNGAPSARSAG